MMARLGSWLAAARRRRRETRLVGQLLRLNDHLLADIGLRRDQLQPDGLRVLDQSPQPAARPKAQRRSPAIAPSLQGCG